MIRESALLLVAACASALNEPSPIAAFAPGHAGGRSVDQLVREGDTAWARRGEPGQAAAAEALYLDAAAQDDRGVTAILRAMRAMSFRIEHDSGASRGELAAREVQLGQWCQRRSKNDGECDYRLAIALGQQARERPSTGSDAVGKMVDLLHHAIATVPRIESGAPHRVLALVLLRAPAWPVGPGDPDAGLREAREAVRLFPDTADNQLVLADALVATGANGQARAVYERALSLATAARDAGDPTAGTLVARARDGLANASSQ